MDGNRNTEKIILMVAIHLPPLSEKIIIVNIYLFVSYRWILARVCNLLKMWFKVKSPDSFHFGCYL